MLGYKPYIAHSQRAKMKCNAIVVLLSALAMMIHCTTYAQLQQDFPVTNAGVSTIVQDSSTLYIGGWFDYAGPNTGNGVVLDTSTGKYNPSFPKVNGIVYASVPDGKGGWYVGGRFSKIGNVYRNSLAHVLSDGSIDKWNPSIAGQLTLSGPLEAAWVYSLVLVDSTVYIGGIFDHVGSVVRNMAAAVNTNTGLPTAWDPDLDNSVKAIIATPSTIYLGGGFHYVQNTKITRLYRSGLASVDPLTGVSTTWDSYVGGSVNTIQLVDSTLYVGGNFFSLSGGVGRNGIGAVHAVTGLVLPWNPNAGGRAFPQIEVTALAISGNTMYIGGRFVKMGPQAHVNLAAANLSGNGTVLPWNPNVTFVKKGSSFSSGSLSNYAIGISSIQVSGSNVYVGGFFNRANGMERRNLAAFDTSTGTLTAWNPCASDPVWVLKKSGSAVFAGGVFTSVNGFTRNGLAAIDLKTKTVNSWNPNVNEPVEALALYGSKMFIGGYFDTVGTQNTAILAAVDKKTGVVDPWTLNTVSAGGIGCLSIYKDRLYVGGWFYKMGDSVRSGIAAIDLKSGKILPWYPGEMRSPMSFVPTDSLVYTAGNFWTVGSDSQSSTFATLNAGTGKIGPPWSPFLGASPSAWIFKLFLRDKVIYGCGKYGKNNPTDPTLFKIDLTTKKVTTFGPALSYYDMSRSVINNIAFNGSTLYMVGAFSTAGGVSRNNIAAIDISTGAVKPWNPNANGSANVAVVDSIRKSVYIGGDFFTINDDPASFLIAYTDTSLGTTTSVVKSERQQPKEFSLDQNYPNPFNPSTMINYQLPVSSIVTLKVYDLLGREVATLVNEREEAGTHRVQFDASRFASGVYFYRIESGSFNVVKKMILIR